MDQKRSLQNKFVTSFDNYYNNNPKIKEIIDEIKVNPFVITYNCCDSMRYLCCFKEENKYNAVRCVVEKKLSKKNRIKILRLGDILESLTISCIDPSDISSAILYVGVAIKKNANIDEINVEKFGDEFECFQSNENEWQMYYIPIKTIEKPETNVIKFYECPFLMCGEKHVELIVEVNFVKNNLYPEDSVVVTLNYLIIDGHIRNNTELCRQKDKILNLDFFFSKKV